MYQKYISTYIGWEKISQKKNQLGLSRAPITWSVVCLGQRGVFGGGCGQAGRVRDILPPHHRSSAHPIHSSSTSQSLFFFHSVASFLADSISGIPRREAGKLVPLAILICQGIGDDGIMTTYCCGLLFYMYPPNPLPWTPRSLLMLLKEWFYLILKLD